MAVALTRALAAGALVAAALLPAGAQTLERLHVKSFTLSVDKSDVTVGDTLHVVIDAKLAEPVAQLDNVTLPQLYGFDVLGDERSCVGQSGKATECTERIAISPTRAGTLIVGPAMLEALDAGANKPMRYQSNYVPIHVVDTAATPAEDPFAPVFAPILHFLLAALIVVIVAVLAFFLVLFLLARRSSNSGKTLPYVPPPVPAGPPVPQVDPEVRFAALVRALDEEPIRMRVLALRAELRARVGAHEKETLADLRARGAGDARTQHLLEIVERGAFVEDRFVEEAARETVARLRAAGAQASPGPR